MPGSTGQLKALWNQILNGTAPAGAASATGDIGQMVKEAIARLDKLVGTTDLGAMTASATGSLGEQLKQIQDLLDQVMGTTNTAAVSADAAGSVVERIKYLSDNLPKGVRKLQGSGYLAFPAAASGKTLSNSGTPWASGSYTEIVSSTGEAEWLLGYTGEYDSSGSLEIDIATGGAGAETVISTLRALGALSGTGMYIFTVPFVYPVAVAASTRIAARMRGSSSSATVNSFAVSYCKQSDLVAL